MQSTSGMVQKVGKLEIGRIPRVAWSVTGQGAGLTREQHEKTMERISNKAIELRVEWLNKALGRPLKPDWGKPITPDSYDKASFYVDKDLGGYRLECAGSPVFGHYRQTKRELCNQLEAILVAIKLARGEKHGGQWPNEQSANFVCINFASEEDTAQFLNGCEKQLSKPKEQLSNLTRGIMGAALQRAKGVRSNLTSEQAEAIRLGKHLPAALA